MPVNRTGPRYFKMMERNALVLKMRREGFTYAEIQDETGMDDSNARRLVAKHLADIPKEEADSLRIWENEKLNELARDALDQALEWRPELDANGKPIYEPLCDENGVVILDANYQPIWRMRRDWNTANQGKAILLKVHEARVKMFGLAAPLKVENTNMNPVEEIVWRVVESDGNGRIAPHCMPQPAPEPVPAEPAPMDVIRVPPPTKLEYHDSGHAPDPDAL